MDSKLSRKRKINACGFHIWFMYIRIKIIKHFWFFKKVSVMMIKKSKQGSHFWKKSFLKARLKHADFDQERYEVNVHEELNGKAIQKSVSSRIKKKRYFITKIGLTYCEKRMFWWLRKTFEFRGWMLRICKIFEITRTIYSNSER